jgi:hypothetical protein
MLGLEPKSKKSVFIFDQNDKFPPWGNVLKRHQAKAEKVWTLGSQRKNQSKIKRKRERDTSPPSAALYDNDIR